MKNDKKNRRDHVVSARVSRDELLQLERKARNSNQSISDLLREALSAIAHSTSNYINTSEGRQL